MSCPCGCGKPVKPGRRYATTSCYWRGNREHMAALGKRPHRDPTVRQRNAQESHIARRRKSLERVLGLTPAEAYLKGYQNGYKRAHAAWKVWAEKQVVEYRAEKRTA